MKPQNLRDVAGCVVALTTAAGLTLYAYALYRLVLEVWPL